MRGFWHHILNKRGISKALQIFIGAHQKLKLSVNFLGGGMPRRFIFGPILFYETVNSQTCSDDCSDVLYIYIYSSVHMTKMKFSTPIMSSTFIFHNLERRDLMTESYNINNS